MCVADGCLLKWFSPMEGLKGFRPHEMGHSDGGAKGVRTAETCVSEMEGLKGFRPL